jgi:uncharacterized membrane protein
MSLWLAILVGAAATYLTKLSGYAVPARWLSNPRMTRVAGAITVALLSALTVMNTFASGTGLVLDARLAAWRWPRWPCGRGCRFCWWCCSGRGRRGWCGGGGECCARVAEGVRWDGGVSFC